MAHIYDVGTRAWQPDVTDGWVASEVEEKLIEGEKVKLIFRLDSGEVRLSSTPVLTHVFYDLVHR
jgi:myosin-5